MGEGISRAEIVASLSLATDLAMGQPLETGLGICAVALGLADEAGLDSAERDRVYYVSLLRNIGCTAENQAFASVIGDEIEFHRGGFELDATTPRAFVPYMLRFLVRSHGLVGAAGRLAQMAAARGPLDEAVP